MGRRSYAGYRGRKTIKNAWGIVLGILLVLAVLVVLLLLFGQRYVYFGGSGVHLDLPFSSSEPAPPDVSKVVVEVLPPAEPDPALSQQEEPVTDPGEAEASVDAEHIPPEQPTE